MIEPYRWWGSALFPVVRAFAWKRKIQDDKNRRYFFELENALMQARYVHSLCGKWPTLLAMPNHTSVREVRFIQSKRPLLLFSDDPVPSGEYITIKVDCCHNTDGFWCAEFAGSEQVMFWPAPREAPAWWTDRD